MPEHPQLSAFSSQPSAFGAKQLEHFRSSKKRLPLHPLEKAVLTAVAVHLCFLPWALGTMHPWSQLTSLVLSSLGFLLALIPRTYSGDHLPAINPQGTGRAQAFRLHPLGRLIRFPIFWIGLALLAYIAVQGFNPSWVWERNANTWWLRRVNDIEWLPTSIDTPFERFNLWRQFIIYTSAWLTVCTVWIGFTRRHALQLLLFILVGNAVALTIVGFFQKFAGLDTYLFLMKWPEGNTAFASFIYRNHAGPYFALMAFVALALATWASGRGERTGKKSNPAGMLVLIAVLLTTAVFFTLSRGASLILVGAWFVLFIWFWFFRSRQPAHSATNPVVGLAVVILFVTVIGGTLRYLDFSMVEHRFTTLFTDYYNPYESVRPRLLAHESARAMLDDYWQRGVGSGGFRFLFPEYIKHKPEIYNGGRLFWEHAHNDWLQIPIELGAAGIGLILLGAGYWLRFFYRQRVIWHALAIPLAIGCAQTLAHAWFDFPFQNPAILGTWLALVTVCARWTELDGQ